MKCGCGSYAINLRMYDRDLTDTESCDVCYWRHRADADAKRLDWVLKNCPYLPLANGHQLPENSRAVIDAAMSAKTRDKP